MSYEVLGLAILLGMIMIALSNTVCCDPRQTLPPIRNVRDIDPNDFTLLTLVSTVFISLYLLYALPSICPELFCDPCGFYYKLTCLFVLFTIMLIKQSGLFVM